MTAGFEKDLNERDKKLYEEHLGRDIVIKYKNGDIIRGLVEKINDNEIILKQIGEREQQKYGFNLITVNLKSDDVSCIASRPIIILP